jgi:hypothetical protein
MGVYVISYVLESQGTRKTNRTWCFVERKIKKTTLEHPFFLYAILVLNNKHVKANDLANRILSYSLLIFFKQFHC